jgi:hypothetical protein
VEDHENGSFDSYNISVKAINERLSKIINETSSKSIK